MYQLGRWYSSKELGLTQLQLWVRVLTKGDIAKEIFYFYFFNDGIRIIIQKKRKQEKDKHKDKGFFPLKKKKTNLTCRRGKKREILQMRFFFFFFFKKKKKKKMMRVGCRILIGVIVANLNFTSSLVNVKLFCSGLFRS